MSTIAHTEELPKGLPFLGNTMLFLGLGILALSLTGTEWLPFNMPRSWYQSPSIWKLLALCLSCGGVAVLKQVSSTEMKHAERNRGTQQNEDWIPEEQGQRFETLTVYTKENCPLCEEAAEILEDYAAYLPTAEFIDIYSDPALVKQFGTCVPVVSFDGKIRFRGRINEVLLRRLIVASPVIVSPVIQGTKSGCGCNKQSCGCKRPTSQTESTGCGSNCRCA
ncbi:glutaredoxin family protein [uncultured Gimesia sp.]|uniref:glutaredoxin family protein n=1 Tax=uncultured Gimesia sp. TaxID=1678688 RepID=UPI0030DC122E